MKTQNSQFQMIFTKQLKKIISDNKLNIGEIVKDIYNQSNNVSQQEIIKETISRIKQTEIGQKIIKTIIDSVINKSQQLYNSQSKQNIFMIGCFKQATSEPFIKNKQQKQYNFEPIYQQQINSQLIQKTIIFKFDHLITPYNIQQQLNLLICKVAEKDNIILKQNQKDSAIRLLEYHVKKYQKLPNQNQYYLIFVIIQLYGYYSPKNILDLGAIYLGLLDLAETYYQPILQERFQLILQAIQLIDKQIYQLLNQRYLKTQKQAQTYQSINQSFQTFRLTFGSKYLPLKGTQFIIDQLLVKKINKFDMYVLYSIMLLILTDQFEKDKQEVQSFKQILNRSKNIISTNDIIDSFKVCYEKIPIDYNKNNIQNIPNALLQAMINKQQKQPYIKGMKNNLQVEDYYKYVEQDHSLFRLGKIQK